MPPLVAALRFPDVMCQRYAAMGIGNFSSNDTNRCAIVTELTLPPLISLTCSEDQEDKHAVIGTLLGIAADTASRIKIVQDGGLPPFGIGCAY